MGKTLPTLEAAKLNPKKDQRKLKRNQFKSRVKLGIPLHSSQGSRSWKWNPS
jgi:hypothetical protein